eukprot:g156.t1
METLCETMIVYIRPPELDPASKGPKRIFEKLRDDFNIRNRRDRCLRLDLYNANQLKTGGQGMISGLDELESLLKDCIKTAFQTRRSAYDEEARKLMSHRMDTKGSFGTLFLVKDSLALLLESVGLLEDALREYYELEAACLEALNAGGMLYDQPFGGDEKGDDIAILMTALWRTIHQTILANKPLKEFKLRQYLFAAQARLLFKLERPTEVVERGLKFIQHFTKLISKNEPEESGKESIREVWAFSACLSVASTAAKYYRFNSNDAQEKDAGNWYHGGQDDSPAKGRIELSDVDWDVGVCGLEDVTADVDFDSLGGNFRKANNRLNVRDITNWQFFSSLGHLYASAREELKRIFNSLHLDAESTSLQVDMLPSFTPVCLSTCRTTSMDSSVSKFNTGITLHRASSMIESIRRHSRMSIGSESQLYDAEGMPSWMTRAGLGGSTPKHSRKSTTLFVQTEALDSPRNTEASFISINSETQRDSPMKDETSDAASFASLETSRTLQTETNMSEGGDLTFHAVEAGSYKYTPSESAISSLDLPMLQPNSPRSLASHALGGSTYHQEMSSDSHQGSGVLQSARVPERFKWVSDWRVRQALSSEELYEDLFVELTLAAAWCYARCGRLRTSALLRVDVAPLLLNHGLDSAAQQLYHMKCDMYLREGWHVLSAHVLPQLSACLKGGDPKTLMATCLTYLSLPEDCVDSEGVQKMMEDFKASAKELGEMDGSASHGALITSPAIQVTPRKNQISVLYEERGGKCTLAPEPIPKGQSGGALRLNAGDVAEIEIEIHSRLPEAILLGNVILCLSAVCPPETQDLSLASTSMMDAMLVQGVHSHTRRRTYRSGSLNELSFDKLQKSSMQLFCSLESKKETQINPGISLLTFQCAPMQEGLYSVLYLSGEYQGTSLCVPLISNEPERMKPSWQNVSAKRKSGFLDALDSLSDRLKDCVVLQVKPALQRVSLSLMSPQGCLVMGHQQWLGVLIRSQISDTGIKSGKLILSTGKDFTGRFPSRVSLSYGSNHGLDEWCPMANGVIDLPEGFLSSGLMAVWMLVDLGSSPSNVVKASSEFNPSMDSSSQIADKTLRLDCQLEYFSGCWRSHCALLKISLLKPFSFEVNFLKMNSTLMLVTICLTSQQPIGVKLMSIKIDLHCSRRQNFSPSLIGNGLYFPMDFHPQQVLNLAFQLTKNEAKILTKDSGEQSIPGELIIEYQLDSDQSLKELDPAIPTPPPSLEESGQLQQCCWKAWFNLDVLMSSEGPKKDLFRITLLPPSGIVLGKPIALTWMLERLGSTHSKESISYEIISESGWQCCVPMTGTLYVPLTTASAVTLEAMFVAMSEGELPAPRLILTQNKIQSPLAFLKVSTTSTSTNN